MRHYTQIITLAVLCVLLCLTPLSAVAETMQSGNYQVRSGTFGSGGTNYATSENHAQSGAFGEALADDNSTSESYQSGGGFSETHGASTPPSSSPAGASGGGGQMVSLSEQANVSAADTPADSASPTPDIPAGERDAGIKQEAATIGAFDGRPSGHHGTSTPDTARWSSADDEPAVRGGKYNILTPLTLFLLLSLLLLLLFWRKRKREQEKNDCKDTGA